MKIVVVGLGYVGLSLGSFSTEVIGWIFQNSVLTLNDRKPSIIDKELLQYLMKKVKFICKFRSKIRYWGLILLLFPTNYDEKTHF